MCERLASITEKLVRAALLLFRILPLHPGFFHHDPRNRPGMGVSSAALAHFALARRIFVAEIHAACR
jgi:hypothetical protein